MKFSTPVLFVSLLSLGFASALPAEILSEEQRLRNFIDDIINSTLSGMISSFSDPISIEKEHFNLTIPGLSAGDADISNFLLAGIRNIVAAEIHSNILASTFNATIRVSELSISTKYDADIVLVQLIPVYGKGKLGVDVQNVELKVSAKYTLSPFSIHDVTLSFDVDQLGFDVHGLLDNEALSALIEEVLNDNVVDFIKNHHAFIDKVLSAVANSIFHKPNKTIAFPELEEEITAFNKKFESLALE